MVPLAAGDAPDCEPSLTQNAVASGQAGLEQTGAKSTRSLRALKYPSPDGSGYIREKEWHGRLELPLNQPFMRHSERTGRKGGTQHGKSCLWKSHGQIDRRRQSGDRCLTALTMIAFAANSVLGTDGDRFGCRRNAADRSGELFGGAAWHRRCHALRR
jgi:hypothetical protein